MWSLKLLFILLKICIFIRIAFMDFFNQNRLIYVLETIKLKSRSPLVPESHSHIVPEFFVRCRKIYILNKGNGWLIYSYRSLSLEIWHSVLCIVYCVCQYNYIANLYSYKCKPDLFYMQRMLFLILLTK